MPCHICRGSQWYVHVHACRQCMYPGSILTPFMIYHAMRLCGYSCCFVCSPFTSLSRASWDRRVPVSGLMISSFAAIDKAWRFRFPPSITNYRPSAAIWWVSKFATWLLDDVRRKLTNKWCPVDRNARFSLKKRGMTSSFFLATWWFTLGANLLQITPFSRKLEKSSNMEQINTSHSHRNLRD